MNAKRGINGKMLDFIYDDNTGKPDVGRSGVEKLISVNYRFSQQSKKTQ